MERSAQRALAVAGTYGAVAVVYIAVSSSLAARFATDVEDLHRVEQIKGMVFVAVTTMAVFAASYVALRRAAAARDELARQRRLLEARERQALAGTMAATIAHDANNVLTALLGELDLTVRARPDLEAELSGARASANRLVTLNRRLSSAAKQETSVDLQRQDVAALVRETVTELRAHRTVRERAVELRLPDAPLIGRVSAILLHQAVTNLVLNAAEATRTGGRVVVVVEAERSPPGGIAIHVDDDGPGVPEDQRDEIFSALRTTKPTGSGLGLYSVRACVTALGGQVSVARSPFGGARFSVHIPTDVP